MSSDCATLLVFVYLYLAGNPGQEFFFLLFNVETYSKAECQFKHQYSFICCCSGKLMSSVTLGKETFTLFYESS